MKKIFFIAVFFFIFALNLSSKDFNEMEESKAILDVDGDIRASMYVSMVRENEGTWKLNSVIKKFGITFRKETAVFKLTKDKIIPLSWKRRGEAEVTFDWDKNELLFKEKKKKGILDLKQDVLGPATAQIKLRLDLRNYELSLLPETLEYYVYFKGAIKKRIFRINGFETINTPLGEFETIKVTREREADQSREQIFWLAPDLDFAIVQILNDDGKMRVKIKLKEVKSFD